MKIFVSLLKDHPTLPPWAGQSAFLLFLDPVLCLCSTYCLQPFMGSTAPFRGRFKVMMRATGQVTMRTRDMRMARTGTKMIPRRTHCMERDTRARTHARTQCKAGCKKVKPFWLHCYLQKFACFSARSLESTQRLLSFVAHISDLYKPISTPLSEIMGLRVSVCVCASVISNRM